MFGLIDIIKENERVFMPPHWHRSLDLTYVLKGELNLRIGSELVTYGEDDLFIINSGDIYETSGVIDPNGEIISFIIFCDFLEEIIPNYENLRFKLVDIESKEIIKKIMMDIQKQYRIEEDFGHLRIRSLLIDCLYEKVTKNQEMLSDVDLRNHNLTQDRLKEIISFIHDNYTDLMTLPSVSKQFHMSREHFA